VSAPTRFRILASRRFLGPCAAAVGLSLFVAAAQLGLAACGGAGVRSGVSVGPRLSSARLGSVRSAMTYDGDWLGGLSPAEDLDADLELAARRGVDFVIDLRSAHAQEVLSLEEAVEAAGLQLVAISFADPPVVEGVKPPFGGLGVSDEAINAVRRILNAPGRRRSLLLDENGTRSSMVYAIHLALDEGVPVAEALRGARSTGLSQDGVDFVRSQVERARP
jgi:protein tyrosine phosphatase (PTP) superfamily phosphohydrolase (DUF442 family)